MKFNMEKTGYENQLRLLNQKLTKADDTIALLTQEIERLN
jgi:hypothetical protein